MSRLLTRKLAGAGAAIAITMLPAGIASAAPPQIRFIDVDSASHGSFVGIYGSGFGQDEGQVQFGSATSIEIAQWTDHLIIARIPADAQSGPVTVVTLANESSHSQSDLGIHPGSVYVVKSNGNDAAAGDEDNPFQSLHRALSAVGPGDTVLIGAGTYDEEDSEQFPLSAIFLRPEQGGTQDKPITFRGFGAELPVIRATRNLSKNSPLVFIGADYIQLARMEVNGTNNTSIGVAVWGLNASVAGLKIHSFGETGITVGETSGVVLKGNQIYNGGTHSNRDHGILMLGTEGSIRNNEVFGLPNGYGIYLSNQKQGTTHVFSNYVHNVAGGGIGLSRVGGDNHVHDNVVWNAGQSQGCRCAVEVAYGSDGGESATADHVYYNTFVGPTRLGMFVDDRDGLIELHSNIFSEFRIGMSVGDKVSQTSLSSSHNIWHNTNEPLQFSWGGSLMDLTQFKTESGQESSSLLTDPKLVDPAGGDMHLSSGSDAIDSGGGPDEPIADFDGVARPKGTGFDIGAFEYTDTSGGAGGSGTGGTGGLGGGSGSAGAAGQPLEAGSGGGSGGPNTDGGTGGGNAEDPPKDGGCGCSLPGSHASVPMALWLGFGILLLHHRRRR